MGMILLSSEAREKNTFEGNKDMFLGTLDADAWQKFLDEFNQKMGRRRWTGSRTNYGIPL